MAFNCLEKLTFFSGIRELGIDEFRAKVKMDNNPSLTLFRDKLKFREVCYIQLHKKLFTLHVV